MKRLGPPRICVVKADDGSTVALEGCHRVRAAAQLGLVPILEYLDWHDDTTVSSIAPGSLNEAGDPTLVIDLIDAATQNSVAIYFEVNCP